MKNIKVGVSCGTKFHSDYLSRELERNNLLYRTITSHPRYKYLNRVNLNTSKTRFLFPLFAIHHLAQKFIGKNRFTNYFQYKLSTWYDWLAQFHLGNTNVLITWAWSGLKQIQKVKMRGGLVILEECGSYNRFQKTILAEEYKNLNLNYLSTTPEYIIDREWKEANLADFILCPSKHVANSFINYGIKPDKCVIIPYGVNTDLFKNKQTRSFDKIKILFVGTVGVRKGLVYLFKALEILKHQQIDFECTVIGSIEDSFQAIFNNYSHLFNHHHRIPHHDLVNYYNKANLFVFPSIDEGMAYVQVEAMACGLPVICTPNSGGDSVIGDNKEGFIIPIRDEISIVEKIVLLSQNPDIHRKMSNQASLKAKQITWENYGKRLASFITKEFNEKKA